MVLKGLDGLLCHIDTVVWWFNKFPFTSFLVQECLDWCGDLIVSHVECWHVAFVLNSLNASSAAEMVVSSLKSEHGFAEMVLVL